ncbi:MAG: eight-cysteine-cluster domain-containing protein [Candidatus Norongarragalinales archaeon]
MKKVFLALVLFVALLAFGCLKKQGSEPTPPPLPSEMLLTSPTPLTFCSTDADCVVGGCSGELCGLRGEELVSTCVWKPEYACFEKTTCGCVDGKCEWKRNAAFNACLASAGT